MPGIKNLSRLHKRRLIHNNKCPSCKKKFDDTVKFTDIDDPSSYYYCYRCELRFSFDHSRFWMACRINKSYYGAPICMFYENKITVSYPGVSISIDPEYFSLEQYLDLEKRIMKNKGLE